MMVIENIFDFGDTVYLTTDTDQSPRIVICIQVYKRGELMYELACGTEISKHYDFELSRERDVNMLTTS